MPATKQLGKEDVLFIAGENASVYQHTAGLVLLDSSAKPAFNFEYFRKKCVERVSLVPHFRWKLHQVPMGLDRPYWVEDDNFDYKHHIKRIALPYPGDRAALSEVVAHLYSRHLDRHKPLWEIWFIEGLEGGKFAILQKLHHSLMDGQGANKLGEILCDFEADPVGVKTVDKAIAEATAGRVPSPMQRSTQTALNLARLPGDAAKSLYDMMRPKILEQFSLRKPPKKDKPVVPTTCFNADISGERGFVFGSLSLADIKTVKDHFDVSVNDVVLGLVSAALRHYLLSRAELPKESLRASIAVSTRTEEDGGLGNKVTAKPVTLATHLKDPVKRLRAINQETNQAKVKARGGAMGAIEVFQMMPPILITTLMATLPTAQIPQIMGANLVVSNVRGSTKPMYIAGARMETMYPMSILTSGIGINITCLSYVDHIDFGIALDPDLVPEPWSLIDALKASLDEYMALTRPKPKRKKAAKSGKKPAIRKKTATARKARPRKKTT